MILDDGTDALPCSRQKKSTPLYKICCRVNTLHHTTHCTLDLLNAVVNFSTTPTYRKGWSIFSKVRACKRRQ